MYVDGVMEDNDTDNDPGEPITADSPITPNIGDYQDHTEDVFGILDELRISNTPRSAEWIATEYNNQYYPDTFYTVNQEDINTSAWTYRKEITINNEKVTGDIDGFPVLIQTTDSDLATYAQSDGDDIVFTDWDGKSQLSHEIELYNSGTGELIAWVKMANISSSSDSTIFMYYNNSDATNSQDDEELFSNGYVGVYHMDESSGDISNSATSTNDGTRLNTPTQDTGQIGYGQYFTGGGSDDCFNISDLGLVDGFQENLTISAWLNVNDSALEDFARVVNKRNNANDADVYTVYFQDQASNKDISFLIGADSGSTTVAKYVWVYLTYTYDGATKVHYHNGSWIRDDTGSTGPFSATPSQAPVYIGARWGPTANYGGMMDEVRISKVTHSAGWISTEFNNQKNPGSFYTFNDEDITPSDWNYRKPITINSSEVIGDLFAFPVLVNITDSDLASDARSDGYDIIFTDSGGESKLCHEIENYTSSSGELVAWVKVPRISSSSDTTIYMYYNKSDQSSATENKAAVWSNCYVGVWHLNETGTGTRYDSTKYDNDGTPENYEGDEATYGGKIDSADFIDGIDDLINATDDSSLESNNITVSLWFKRNGDQDSSAKILAKGDAGPAPWGAYKFEFDGADETTVIWHLGFTDNTEQTISMAPINDAQWYYFVGSYDGATQHAYLDGFEPYSMSPGKNLKYDGVALGIGSAIANTNVFNGTIDEVRISNVVRSSDWVNASFSNQNDTASFLYPGSEESTTSSTTVVTTNYEWVELYNTGASAIDLTGWTLNDNDGNSFSLSGAGSLSTNSYVVCHLGESGTNSSTDVYGPIINSNTPNMAMLENSDDLALVDQNGIIIDYVAWGADAGTDDDEAVTWSQWTDGEYVDTSELLENQTIGRDQDSNDTNLPADWEDGAGKADPFGIDRSTANGSTPRACNVDFIIPEFSDGIIPITGFIIMIIVLQRKSRKKPNKSRKVKHEEGGNKL
jgi:hypothetical protein